VAAHVTEVSIANSGVKVFAHFEAVDHPADAVAALASRRPPGLFFTET
jgi:hypothetical protein